MRIAFIAIAVSCLACTASAQPLTDRVPADATLYFGWRGTDTLGATYDNSHLAAVMKGSGLRGLVDVTLPQLLAKMPQDKPEEAANVQVTIKLLQHAWARPTVVFVGIGPDARGKPESKLGFICDAGDVAADFQKSLEGLVAADKATAKVKIGRDGNLVALTMGYPDALAAIKPASALRAAPAFVSAMKQVDADALYTLFLDADRLVQFANSEAAKDKKATIKWPAIRDAFGLAGLKRIVMTGGFAGPEWSSRMFIESPAPRAGILSMMVDQPIRETILGAIPKTASYAMVHQFDLGKLLRQIRQSLSATDPSAIGEFDKAMATAQKTIGRDVQSLLDLFGDQWAVYADSGVGGPANDGIIILNEVKDAAKAEDAIKRLIATAIQLANQRGGQLQIATNDQPIGEGLTVHTIGFPQGQVGWIIKNNKLFIGFNPNAVAAATLVGTQAAGAANIAQNEKFNALKQRLGATKMTGFEFADLQQTAPQKHAAMQQMLPMVAMMAQAQGVTLPPDLLPPLPLLQQHLSPSGMVSWVDETGWHSRGIQPFPGSKLFAAQQTDLVAVGTASLGVSILLPSLNRARETANRVKCASNMRQIGQACFLYANEHKGQFPDSLGPLIKTQDIGIEAFSCPSGDIEASDAVIKGGLDTMAAWADKESPYVYIGKGLTNHEPADRLVLYEREDDHGGGGMNMLFGDGHVEWNSMEQAKQIIAKNQPK